MTEAIMLTLDRVLRQDYGYTDAEFGSAGRLAVDSQAGTLAPLPEHRAEGRDLVIRLAEVFEVGQELDLIPLAGSGRHSRFCILEVGNDGLLAIAPDGRVGFLPWEMLAQAISTPTQVQINPLHRAPHESENALRASRAFYETRLEREKAAVRMTRSHLNTIDERLKSSS